MGKKKKASHEAKDDEHKEKESEQNLTSELIEEEKVESSEPVQENSEYENHPKFHKFRGEK